MTGVSRAPLTWRIPPWQPALLFLIAAGCAAANAYVHVSVVIRIVTIVVGVAALAMGIAAARMYLVVDDEGIGVRRLWRERSLDWDDISRVSVVGDGMTRACLAVDTLRRRSYTALTGTAAALTSLASRRGAVSARTSSTDDYCCTLLPYRPPNGRARRLRPLGVLVELRVSEFTT